MRCGLGLLCKQENDGRYNRPNYGATYDAIADSDERITIVLRSQVGLQERQDCFFVQTQLIIEVFVPDFFIMFGSRRRLVTFNWVHSDLNIAKLWMRLLGLNLANAISVTFQGPRQLLSRHNIADRQRLAESGHAKLNARQQE
jgi:hypothetical protein